MKKLNLLMVTIVWTNLAFSQSNEPVIGQVMPPFEFSNVKYFGSVKTVSNQTFKGKWLFLNMWSPTCLGCVRGFPAINDLQAQLGSEVQFFLVGKERSTYGDIRSLYERVRTKQNLKLPIAFDSASFARWNISSVPKIYVIDPQGVLSQVVVGRDFTADKIRRLVRGEPIQFNSIMDIDNMPNFSISESFGPRLLSGCVLSEWNGEVPRSGFDVDLVIKDRQYHKGELSEVGVPLYKLYNLAYWGRDDWADYDRVRYGNVREKPILQLADSSVFSFDTVNDVGKGFYNFSIRLPQYNWTREAIMAEMQRSLAQTFGFKVTIEKRMQSYWKLVVVSGRAVSRLKTKGGEEYLSDPQALTGFAFKNQSTTALLRVIGNFLPNDQKLPFLDETDIHTNIDIVLEGDMGSYPGVSAALRKHGLDLVRGEKLMSVLLISNPN